MDVRPGYKQTEAGVIPNAWGTKSLDAIALVTSGKRLPLGASLTERETARPYVRVTDMRPGTVSLADIKYVPVEVFPAIKRYRIFKDDIFITVAGTLGIVGKIPSEINGANLTENADRITNISCSQDYLLYVLMSPLIQSKIDSLQTVGAQPKLALTRIRKFDIPLPPTKSEQEAIAEALSDADALIESLEQLLTKKRQIKKGAMQELLTGNKRLPGFSEEWDTKAIGDFADCTSGGTPSTSVPDYWGGSIRWMSSGELNRKSVEDVEGRITERGLRESSAKVVLPRCVLVGLAGQGKTRGTVAINLVELCTNQSIAAILPNDFFVPEYLYFNLDSRYEELRDISSGDGGRGGLNLRLIRSIDIPFPDIDEQTAIANILSDMDAEISALEAKLSKARQLKQGMMQELLTGRIRLL